MKRSSDPTAIPSHRIGRRMFGDYPIDNPGYWIWMAGVIGIGLFSLLLMFTIKE